MPAAARTSSPGLAGRLLAPLESLRARLGGRVALAVMAVMVLLVVHNVWCLFHNQSTWLSRDRFKRTSRDIEHVTRHHYRWPVSDWLSVFYLLEQRIGGKKLTIPNYLGKARWEFEKIGQLRVEVSDGPMRINRQQARAIRGKADVKRPFQIGTRRYPWNTQLHILRDPHASHFLMVRWRSELYVLSEAEHAKLAHLRTPPQ